MSKDRIKTVLFSSLFPSDARPRHGIFVETRLRHLLQSGSVTTCVIAPVPWFPSKRALFGSWSTYARIPRREQRRGVSVFHPRYVLPPKVGMASAPLLMALGALSAFKEVAEKHGDFDLIDAHYYYPDGVAAAILGRWLNKPVVVTGRGTDLNVLPNYRIPRAWIRWAARNVSASIVVCEALRVRLNDVCGEECSRTLVVRNGVDLREFSIQPRMDARSRVGLSGSRRWVISVGNLVPEKGFDLAIEALTFLPDNVGLVIVGEGPERRALEARVKSRMLSERVVFTGTLPQRALAEWYSAADVLALCSSREGWANVLLESMACGTPVVATRVGGTPEVVTEPVAGRLVKERSPASIARAIQELLSESIDPLEVRAYASRFGWDETSKAQLELFRQIVVR